MLRPVGLTLAAFAAGELDESDACAIVVNDQVPLDTAPPFALTVAV
jgi:hypothetical protein